MPRDDKGYSPLGEYSSRLLQPPSRQQPRVDGPPDLVPKYGGLIDHLILFALTFYTLGFANLAYAIFMYLFHEFQWTFH